MRTFFLHVPRTGGTSLWRRLVDNGVSVYNIGAYNKEPPSGADVYQGHFIGTKDGARIDEVVQEPGDRWFTILRNPWQRFESWYAKYVTVGNEKKLAFDPWVEKMAHEYCTADRCLSEKVPLKDYWCVGDYGHYEACVAGICRALVGRAKQIMRYEALGRPGRLQPHHKAVLAERLEPEWELYREAQRLWRDVFAGRFR